MNRRTFLTTLAAAACIPVAVVGAAEGKTVVWVGDETCEPVLASELNEWVVENVRAGDRVEIVDVEIDGDEPLRIPSSVGSVHVEGCRFTVHKGVEAALQIGDGGSGIGMATFCRDVLIANCVFVVT